MKGARFRGATGLLAVLVTGCAATQLRSGETRPATELAVLVTNPTQALVLDGIDGRTPPAAVNRYELPPGKHVLQVHSEVGAGARFRDLGATWLTFVAEAGHTYRLRGAGEVSRQRWTARVDEVAPGELASRTSAPAAELEAACGRGVAASCLELGIRYERGDTERGWDEARAAAMYERACTGGQPLGCNNLGSLYESGHGVEQNEARAAELFEEACSAGEPRGCTRLGARYQEGRGGRKNERRAAELYEKACGAGEPMGCYSLGNLYREGRGVEPDETRVASLYEKSCSGGEPKGCAGLGLLYEDGLGVDQDEGRAAALYEKACAGGAAMGCANLGVLYQLGLGVGRNERRAGALFEKACASGVESACASLAKLSPAARTAASGPAAPPSSAASLRKRASGGGAATASANASLAPQLSLRAEADVLHPGLIGAISGELAIGRYSGVFTVLARVPPALRFEGRFYPFQWGPVRSYAGLGVSLFAPALAARALLGVDVQLAPLHLFSDVAFERFINPTPGYASNSLLLSLGAGWRF